DREHVAEDGHVLADAGQPAEQLIELVAEPAPKSLPQPLRLGRRRFGGLLAELRLREDRRGRCADIARRRRLLVKPLWIRQERKRGGDGSKIGGTDFFFGVTPRRSQRGLQPIVDGR